MSSWSLSCPLLAAAGVVLKVLEATGALVLALALVVLGVVLSFRAGGCWVCGTDRVVVGAGAGAGVVGVGVGTAAGAGVAVGCCTVWGG